MYLINCTVSGGITGYRQSLLKENGKVVRFDSYEAAQNEADRLNTEMNANSNGASFSYSPITE